MEHAKSKQWQMYHFQISMKPEDIVYFSWTLSTYEGIGFVTTDDSLKGLVSVYSPQGNEDIMREVIDSFSREISTLRIIGENLA